MAFGDVLKQVREAQALAFTLSRDRSANQPPKDDDQCARRAKPDAPDHRMDGVMR